MLKIVLSFKIFNTLNIQIYLEILNYFLRETFQNTLEASEFRKEKKKMFHRIFILHKRHHKKKKQRQKILQLINIAHCQFRYKGRIFSQR